MKLFLPTVVCHLLLGISSVDAHGYMSVPKSRNLLASERPGWPYPEGPVSYGPQSLNAGGRRTSNFVYPETSTSARGHGLCGDAPVGPETCWSGGSCEEQDHMPGGKFYTPGDGGGAIQATYLEGDEIDVTFRFTAHHMGHVSLRLCDEAYVTQDCLDKYPPLKRVAFETGELREAQPINPNYPELFYLSPKCYTDAQQGAEYVMTGRFKLPEGVQCDNCVLQMWWVSANSCTPPGYGDGFHSDLAKSWPCVGDTGFYNPELGTCVGNTLGEEFWNCADISIASRATTAAADTTITTTTTTTAAADTTTTTTITAADTTTTTTTTTTAAADTTTTAAELITTTTRTNSADKRIVAYVPNWTTCPSAEQLKHYTHAMVAFAVTYPAWQQFSDNCATDTSCTVQPVPGCGGKTLKQMTDDLHAAGLKVILSFGGASMGGTWASSVDRCWDHCLDKAQSLVGQLEQVVSDAGVDGLDIDYEYFLDQAPQRAFLEELVVGLHARLHSKGVELTHAPMDVDLCDTSFDQQCRSHYRDILRAHADKIDFIMPQFYNGVTRPTINFAKANELFTSLKVDMFGGDGSKVVMGVCNGDCASTGSNANAAQALGIMQQLQSAHSDMGGMMFWDSTKDVGGAWSQAVYQYFRCDLGALSSKGPQQSGECTTDTTTTETETTATTTTTTAPATTTTVTATTAADTTTITPSTTTATTTTTTTSPASDGTCASVWQQCGGQGHQSRCCKAGSQCFKKHEWYSQCRPTCPTGWECSATAADTTTTTPSTTSTPATATATTTTSAVADGTCASVWQRCGGHGHQSRCCETGSQCFKQHEWYSQCRPTCPNGWECSRRRNLRGSA